MLYRIAVALAVPLGLLPGQDITFAEGSPTSLSIVQVPESAPTTAGTVLLANVELLPVEITGRTLAQENDPTTSRRELRNGLWRVELPGNGRLFRYRRLGGQFWGFLHVDAQGTPRAVLELPGTGAGGTQDPFVDRIAVARDGLHAAMALAATGMHVVRLDGAAFASTGRADRFVATSAPVEPTSVMTGAAHVFFVTADTRIWRCALADGGVPFDATPPPPGPNSDLEDSLAMSGDGTTVAFLYGPRDLERLFLLGPAGAATLLPPPAAKYEEPGYLPEEPGVPGLLLNHDGSRLFYVDATSRDELFLLDTTGQLPSLQITDDPIFQPYIGVYILPSFAAGPLSSLVIAIGDPNRMDWFAAQLTAQGGAVRNLTATGSPQPPFPSGTIDPVGSAQVQGALLVAEQGAGALGLRRIDLATGAQALLQQDVLAPPLPGSAVAGVPDVVVRGAGGDRLYRGQNGTLLAATPPGLLLDPPSQGPQYAATWVHLAIPWGAIVLYLPDGTAVAAPIEYGVRQLAMTAAGGMVVVGPSVRYLAPGVHVVLPRPAAPFRAVLSGASG